MGSMIEFASNGSTDPGYLAGSEGGSGPGVVVIQEWWGLVDHIKDVCDRFAAEGFLALAPDLYHGAKTVEPDEAAKAMMALRLDQAGRDMSGAVDEVARRSGSDSVGVVGFCMGGGLALMLASQRPDKVRAVVPFYGVVPWQGAQPDYSKLSGAVLGHYAGKDESASPEAARALVRTLRDAGNGDVSIHIYPEADHAFFNDTRPEVYDPEGSALAWQRTIDFLRSHLG
jgi:carboxymethylenebutenolidase